MLPPILRNITGIYHHAESATLSHKYPTPDKNRSKRNTGKVIAKLDSMPNMALTVMETINMPLRPKESPRPPQR